MLLQLSWHPLLCPPPPGSPHSLRQPPRSCPCARVMHIYSLATIFPKLYFTSLWLFFFNFFHIFYYCSSIVVSIFPPPTAPHPSHPHFTPLIPPLFGFIHVTFIPCDYSAAANLCFLIPSPLSPAPPPSTDFLSGNRQNVLCIYDSVSVLLVLCFKFNCW